MHSSNFDTARFARFYSKNHQIALKSFVKAAKKQEKA